MELCTTLVEARHLLDEAVQAGGATGRAVSVIKNTTNTTSLNKRKQKQEIVPCYEWISYVRFVEQAVTGYDALQPLFAGQWWCHSTFTATPRPRSICIVFAGTFDKSRGWRCYQVWCGWIGCRGVGCRTMRSIGTQFTRRCCIAATIASQCTNQ